MKKLVMIICFVVLVGCSTTTRIYEGEDLRWRIESRSDAVVTMKDGDKEVTVDNRGKPNVIESAIGAATMGIVKGK